MLKKGGRKKNTTAILTDTPEKSELEKKPIDIAKSSKKEKPVNKNLEKSLKNRKK